MRKNFQKTRTDQKRKKEKDELRVKLSYKRQKETNLITAQKAQKIWKIEYHGPLFPSFLVEKKTH